MPTESYIIAQKIISKIKSKHPRIFTISGKNTITFFPGSDLGQVVQFRRMIGRSAQYWETFVSERYEESEVRKWRTRINGSWLGKTYNKILRNEICTEMGISEDKEWNISDPDFPHHVIGRAIQISKMKLWGIPVDLHAEGLYFHRILVTCAKKTVPETTWKIACRNAGNVYGINDNVMIDAIVQEKVYKTLYAIHPLLGLLWTPMPRRFVEKRTGERADSLHYAKQVASAMRSVGLQRSGMKTLHRIAEKEPMTARRVICRLVGYGHGQTTRHETVALLNLLNGSSPHYGASFQSVIRQIFRYEYEEENPGNLVLRDPQDLLVIATLHKWLGVGDGYEENAGTLIMDWAESRAKDRPGSLHCGFQAVLKNCEVQRIRSPARRKAAILAWADRAMRQWHRNLPYRQVETAWTARNVQWEPLLGNLDIDLPDGRWSFIELTTSEALREEGDAMEHCVAGYDLKCADGQSHIFSVRNANGERVSTLEIGYTSKSKRKFIMLQNRGIRNCEPPKPCCKAAKKFLNYANEIRKHLNNGIGEQI